MLFWHFFEAVSRIVESRSDLIANALVSRSSGPGSSPG